MIQGMAPCPICGRPAASRPDNRLSPFCTARCKQIDLGKWLSEDYRVPVEDDPATLDEPASAGAAHSSQESA
jgi:endogenous inhibitor of DNA gyrase (YacG/DUF329 family)